MAKRAAQDEPVYNPIDQALVNAATAPVVTEKPPAPPVSRTPHPAAEVAPPSATVPASAPEHATPVRSPVPAGPSFTRPAAQPGAETSQPTQQPAPSNVVHMPASHMAQPKPGEGRSRVSTADPNERFQDRRIPLSPAEDAELERLITAFASEMGAKVKGTHVGRALFGIFMDAYDHVLDRGRRAPRMKRPGNGDPIGLMKFEEHVRETIESGLRDYLTRGRGQQR